MAQRTRFWATAVGTAALISLPLIGAAQSYPPSSSGQSTTGQTTSSSQSSSRQYSSSDKNSPQFHLDKAKKVLDSIKQSSLTGEAATKVSQIRTGFDKLYNDYKSSSGKSSSSSTSSAAIA